MKKSWYTTLLTGLLAAVMLLALSACGISSIPSLIPGGDKADGVVGTWEADMDMTDSMKEALSSDELGMDLDDISFVMKLRLTLNDDGTYTIEADEDTARSEVENLIKAVKKPLVDAIEKELKDSGISVADLLKMTGAASLEAYVEEMLSEELDVDEMIDGITEGNDDGTYEFKDGKVYFDGDSNAAAELKDGKLIIDDADASGIEADLLPLEFKKVR